MTPTNQTKFSAFTSKGERITYGNCLVACIASILDVDIHEVPNIYTLYGITRPQHPDEKVPLPYWAEVLNMWMREKHGRELEIMTAMAYASRVTKDAKYPRTAIVRGMSHRDKPHCCIYHLGTLVWDPHPSREGLKEMKSVYVIRALVDEPKQPLPEDFLEMDKLKFTIDHDKILHYALHGKTDPLQAIEERKKALAELHEEEELPEKRFIKCVKVVIDGVEETVFVGDTVITKGYTEDYDGKELTITRIFALEYCHFIPHTESHHNFHRSDIVKIVRRKGEVS